MSIGVDVGNGEPEELLPAVAEEPAGRLVDVQEPPVGCRLEDGLAGVVQHKLPEAQLLLGLLALGDVGVDLEARARAAAFVRAERPAAEDDDLRAVAAGLAELAFPAPGLPELGGDLREGAREHGAQALVRVAAEHLYRGEPVHARGTLVPVDDTAPRVPVDDGVRREIQELRLDARHLLGLPACAPGRDFADLALHRGDEPPEVPLGEVVVRPHLHGLDGDLLAHGPRDHDEGRVHPALLEQGKRRRGAERRERVVRDHEVPGPPREGGRHPCGRLHALPEDAVAPALQLTDEQVGVVLRVLDDEEAQRYGHHPLPRGGGSLSTSQ
jgi:hypothetical protein